MVSIDRLKEMAYTHEGPSDKIVEIGENTRVWSDVFFNKSARCLNPSEARLEIENKKNEPVRFYNLIVQSVEGINKRVEDGDSLISVQMTFFDGWFKKFFGLTWRGPPKGLNDAINFDESVYFCSSINDNYILIVIELVAISRETRKSVSVGWTAFRPYMDNPDVKRRLSVFAGTPRALMFIQDSFEQNKNLKELPGIYVNYSFQERPRLDVVKKFLPENVFLGRFDKIGGIMDSAPKHCLEKPRLVPQLSVIIDDLYIYLNPNIVKFESEFLQLVADDKSLWDNIKIEPSMISIDERRIKIGVHNGWRYLHEPYVVQLSVDDPSNAKASMYSKSKRLSLKNSFKPRGSVTDISTEEIATRLVMRNSIVLNDVFEDPACGIAFSVEYIINVPIQVDIIMDKKNKDANRNLASKKQFETHHILVRWGVHCPFANDINSDMDSSRVEIKLFGTGKETLNPENKLIFKRPDTNMQDEVSSRLAPGRISFDLRKGNHVNFKQPNFDDAEPAHQAHEQGPIARYDDRSRSRDPYASSMQQTQLNSLYQSMMSRPDENFLTPQGNLLMSQLMQKNAESQRLVGAFGGNLELYPVYNPSYHMPILSLLPGQMGGRTISRAAYAKLHSAQFPPILDRNGNMAEVQDGSTYIQFNLQKEEGDNLACNQIVFQFLAFSRTHESMIANRLDPRPKNIFFTFQFYRFPEFKTPKLKLDHIIEDYSSDAYSTPFILKYVEKDRNGVSESPGYMISYSIDPTNLKFGEKKIFLEYLANHAMFIDVWDGDSLHLIGTSTLQLKDLLRQGKEAVQSAFELDVISVENDDDSRLYSGNTYKDGAALSSDSHIKLEGLLHLRIGNIGSPIHDPNDPIHQTSLAPSLPFTRVIASKTSLSTMGEQLLTKKIDETTAHGFLSHQISKAHHMTETFKDIHAALASTNNKNVISDSTNPTLDAVRSRKLHRMELARKTGNGTEPMPQLLGYHKRIIEERKKDLKIMEFYRTQTKHDQIMNKLHEYITTEYAIYPNFGIVEFFEFVLTNPYNEGQTITIIIDDPDIQVVTDSREWRHLKILHQIYSQVEDNMFHRQELAPADPNGLAEIKYPQVYLRAKETVNIPFKYQTFVADNRVEYENGGTMVARKDHGLVGNIPAKYDMKKCSVYFRAEDRNPIAILRLIVDQQPHVVNQTLRFNECENSFLKKTVRLPSSTKALATNATALLSGDIKLDGTVTDQATTQLYVRSSDPNIVCESRPVTIGEPHDVFIKVATGPAPTIKKFYLAIYADQYLAVPLQIWQVYVHSLQRIDVTCSLGQTSRFSLILKGTPSSRVVRSYPSAPDEMSLIPESNFMLGANAVQEINAGVQPRKTGVKHYYLNVVDVEMSCLVNSWFINVNCKPPVISKSFELTMPVSTAGGNVAATYPSQKRVSFTNPYATEKVFILSTNRDDLVMFKDRRIKFMANEQKGLSLKFLPNPLTGFVEIYVFINNENDTNEETFALRVHYVKQLAN